MQMLETADVQDSRRKPRFLLDPPLEGSYRGEPVRIYNIGEDGVQIETRERIIKHDSGELRFSLPTSPKVMRMYGKVKWCRTARTSGPAYTWPFRCGIEVQGVHALTLGTLAQLIQLEMATPDAASLERKKKLLSQTQGPETDDLPRAPEVPQLDTLSALIDAVRGALATLARQREAIPKLAAVARPHVSMDDQGSCYGDEILAVWEYLHRCTPPKMVALVFDLDTGS